MSARVKEWEPMVLVGSSLGYTAVCSCNWRTRIEDTLHDAVERYHDHVIAAGHELRQD